MLIYEIVCKYNIGVKNQLFDSTDKAWKYAENQIKRLIPEYSLEELRKENLIHIEVYKVN